jgi:acyl-CoA reductase-like NAD-dependent aldehyde dehydrogenase
MDRKAAAVTDTAPTTLHHLLIDGQWVEGAGPRVTVHDKFRLEPFATITTADAAQVRHVHRLARPWPTSAAWRWTVPPR